MKLPYGYVFVHKEIVVQKEKANTIRNIFESFLLKSAWIEVWTCFIYNASFPHLTIRNGVDQR